MTENPPPPPPGTPEGGGTPPPPQNPYGSQPSSPPPPPQNPYSSAPPPSSSPYAGNPPNAGQTPYGATPYPASPYPETPQGAVAGARPGGLGSRLLARIIDGILFAIVDGIFALITGNNRVLTGVVGGVLYVAYYTYMESTRGHTFGKQIMGLRVLGPTGANPTTEEAFRRNAWAALSILSGIFLLGALASLVEFIAIIAIAVTISQDNVARRGWHDKFGNTTVIKES
jgi:uncharacterized RDD family membrane protein YckC